MAGAPLPNGPIQPPDVTVQQIFRLNQPLPVDSGLPTVYIGVNRHIEYEEELGSYVGGGSDVELTISSLLDFAGATIVDIDSVSWVDSEDDSNNTTRELPYVFMRHPLYGDLEISEGASGYTIDSANATLTVDSGLSLTVDAVDSSTGAYTAWGTPNYGRRTFTDLEADFLESGVEAGNTIWIGGIAAFDIISVSNSTQLIVEDATGTNIQPSTEVASGVNYVVKKTLTGSSLSGPIYITYAANRTDRLNQIQTVVSDTREEQVGLANILNPLGLATSIGLLNTNTSVLALQIDADNVAGHTEALEVLSNTEVPYNLVPLTQEDAVLALYQSHVVSESDPDVKHERRLWQSKDVLEESCKVDDNDSTFQTLTTPTDTDVTFTVLAGGKNIHTFGVEQGDVLKDTTPGFGGEGRIVSITPTGGDDDPVNVILASPNTLGQQGGQAEMTLDPGVGAQQGGFRVDTIGGALAGETLTILGQVFTNGVEWTNMATLVDAINNTFDGALTASDQGAGELRVVTDTGGWTDARLLAENYTVSTNITGATLESISGSTTPVTQFVIDDMPDGIQDGETFQVRDQAGTVVTFEFDNQLILNNGDAGDGSSVTAGAFAVLVGGPAMSSTDIRDQIIDAINRKVHTGEFTAEADAVTPLVRITADATGQVGATPASGTIVTTIGGQEGGAQIDVSGALVGETVTIAGTVFTNAAVPALSTEWSNAAELASAINANIPNVNATDAGTVVTVRTTTYGWTNALLLSDGLTVADTVTGADWTRVGGAALSPAGQFNIEGATAGVRDGETFTINDGLISAVTFEFDRDGSVGAGNVAINVSALATASQLATAVESAINASSLSVTANAVGGTVTLTHDIAGTVGNNPVTETVADAGFTVTGLTGGGNGTMVGAETVSAVAFTVTSVSAGTGAINGSPLTDWEICTNPLTVDQRANEIARVPLALDEKRVSNVWPSSADIVFTDESAGLIGDLEELGIFNGADAIVQSAPGYYICAALAARRSGLNPALPLTNRPLSGIYQLREVRDVFTRDQLLRIGSTGNTLMEQRGGEATSITAVRCVTTDVTDLKVAEESVVAQVDNFTRDVRLTARPIFGQNVIDPEGQFLDLFSAKVQSVINRYTDRANRRARSIRIRRVFEDPNNKDTVIMEVDYNPLFGANQGIIRLFI